MRYLVVDKGNDMESMRQEMRSSMRGSSGSYRHDGTMPMMRNDKELERWYRMGYKHGWEDSEDDDMEFRRQRDSRGRFI